MSLSRLLFPPVVAMLSFAAGCDKLAAGSAAAPAAPPPPAIPVVVALAAKTDVPVMIRTIGSVESKARVVLRPQIAGRLIELSADEGTDVAVGQMLVKIDPRPFEAALAREEANLARARAVAEDAHHFAERTATAAASAALSKAESEAALAKSAAADADILSGQAAVNMARLNLAYCNIAAPFAGRLGSFMVKPGSIVKENETDLVELAQIDPIEVTFSVPEENIPAIREAMTKGVLEVQALPSGDSGDPAAGSLTFVDNKVDPATSTIRLKATFKNEAKRLWPGQFTNITLVLGHDADAVVVPESAVQTTQTGSAIFVVKANNTVELRPVQVKRVVSGQTVISDGIAAGDKVVTEGQLRLASGFTVQIKPPQAQKKPN